MSLQTYFNTLPPTPASHFRLLLLAAVLRLLHRVSQTYDTWEAMFVDFPSLARYNNELIACGLVGFEPGAAEATWMDALLRWEAGAAGHLPLRALGEGFGLSREALLLLMLVGLPEEDGCFGQVYESVQTAGQSRPIVSLLTAWGGSYAEVRRLLDAHLVAVVNPDAPRGAWALYVPGVLWDVLRTDPAQHLLDGVVYRPPDELCELDDLVLPPALSAQLRSVPALLMSGEVNTVIVRGAAHNGRRTTVGALARALGCGLLEINPAHTDLVVIGALAVALGAIPVFVLDLMLGEAVEVPTPPGYEGLRGVILGLQGGLRGAADGTLTLTLNLPDPEARCVHWQQALGDTPAEWDAISERYRLPSGTIYRVARLARAGSALAGRAHVALADVRDALSTLNRQQLELFAVREKTEGDWTQFAVNGETMSDLQSLERRCRYREYLPNAVGAAFGASLNTGVRALFNGPSGTGKTLSARLLAASLQMELYRVDLGAVVNKYIGETEKNLNQLFTRAEELDVILLLDEGDALLTRRTDVHSANDRYANLETNFLLQRLENYGGIVIVTTNAGNRIDQAFQRRMDAVIEFRLPDPNERWEIWRLHLPLHHAIENEVMVEVAARCVLTGGQIRNAALHASLLAIDQRSPITSSQLVAAVQREYRKSGEVCPLRPQRS
jgi:hypothetical protein